MAMILLVEDEQLLRWGLRRLLESHGHSVHEAPSLAAAELHVKEHRPDVVLLDMRLPDGNGLDFLAAHQTELSESIVVVVTASGQVEAAVRAIKLGAFDFLNKPVKEDELVALVAQALERQQERNAVERSKRHEETDRRTTIVAEARKMLDVLKFAKTVAASPASNVLIQGETGTGKEVLARYVHAESPRAAAPLIAVNCATLPETLVESELFGHEKGSFTDARTQRKGVFELAHGGTVVLDEVGEIPLGMQPKLLRFLEDRSFRRVGGGRDIYVDVRILALWNRNLEDAVRVGQFRSDLFFRLNVFPIFVPPLRERKEDIEPLALHFVRHFGQLVGKSFTGIEPELRERLLAHEWPGNVRELRNLMERAAILEPAGKLAGSSIVHLSALAAAPVRGEERATSPAAADRAAPAESNVATGRSLEAEIKEIPQLEDAIYDLLRRAVDAANGNQSLAAKLLGVSRDQVRYRVKRYREEGRWEASAEDEAEV